MGALLEIRAIFQDSISRNAFWSCGHKIITTGGHLARYVDYPAIRSAEQSARTSTRYPPRCDRYVFRPRPHRKLWPDGIGNWLTGIIYDSARGPSVRVGSYSFRVKFEHETSCIRIKRQNGREKRRRYLVAIALGWLELSQHCFIQRTSIAGETDQFLSRNQAPF